MTRSPFRKGYLNLPTAYKRYAFEFSGKTFHKEMLHRRCWSNSVLRTLIYNTATRPPLKCRCFLLFLNFRYPLACTLTLGGWLDSLGWNFTVKVPPQEIILGQCAFPWDQSCSLVIQVRYFSGLSIVNLIFLLYCASNDIYFCNIVCMWLYWALWDMESYFWVHLLY